MCKEKSPPKAFTLVELLSVLAVLAVLFAILIPVVSSVMASRLRVDSVSKLRSIGSAASLYAIENNNEIVAWEMYGETQLGYSYFLAPYLGDHKGTPKIVMQNAWKDMSTDEVPAEFRYYDGNMQSNDFPGLTFACNGYFNYKQMATIPSAPKERNARLNDVINPSNVVYFVAGWAQFFTDAGQSSMTFPSESTNPGVCPRSERIYFPNGESTPALFLDGSVSSLTHPIPKTTINMWVTGIL